MNSKKIVYRLGIVISATLFLFSLTFGIRTCRAVPLSVKTFQTTSEFLPTANVFDQVSPVSTQPMYIVRLIGKTVRVEDAGNENDYRILSCIDPRLMREADREMLRQGISLYSQTELLSFLEDFCS